jgi:transglutaminase-like putative cysteine protease
MITYQLDDDHYNSQRSEYWASPLETIRDRRGDCEDFAILKYFALRHLDVEAARLFVITVGPTNEDKLNHAVLAVDIRDAANDEAGKQPVRNFVILNNDSSRNGLLVPENTDQYKLYAAYSEAGIWSVPQPPKPPTPKPDPAPVPPQGPCTCSVPPS